MSSQPSGHIYCPSISRYCPSILMDLIESIQVLHFHCFVSVYLMDLIQSIQFLHVHCFLSVYLMDLIQSTKVLDVHYFMSMYSYGFNSIFQGPICSLFYVMIWVWIPQNRCNLQVNWLFLGQEYVPRCWIDGRKSHTAWICQKDAPIDYLSRRITYQCVFIKGRVMSIYYQ